MKFLCEQRVGRVIELRVFELKDSASVAEYSRATLDAMSRIQGNVLICADHRPVKIYSPEVTDGLVALFSKINPRLLRAALIVSSTNATFAMQTQRIVRESKNDQRAVFTDVPSLLAWIGAVATVEELARIREHLDSA